ncbi:4414_t:CDS:2 [Dentiscutata erythropus]|uniref:4414_t:CDS:1 n=1 Tax=Dentiscutata erythropus TaxID=1348616 RepID=A0A9N9CU93_9GLOM|nr:4414_t:CDS:2 [Dentiscutata erythropus]
MILFQPAQPPGWAKPDAIAVKAWLPTVLVASIPFPPLGICANCRNNNLPCVYIPGRKRGPKINSQFLPSVNPCETTTNALCTSSNDFSSFETLRPCNYNIISPNIHNESETFQIMSISQSFLPSFFPFVHEEPLQNDDPLTIPSSIRPEQNNDPLTIPSSISYLNDSSSNETPININSYGTAEIFQIYLNESSSVETPINIDLYGTAEIFQNVFLSAHEGPAQSNDPLTIPSTISYLNDSSSSETPDLHNNGTNESFQNTSIDQSFMLSSSHFVHEGLMQNDELDLSRNATLSFINHLIDSSSFEITDNNNTPLSVRPYETTEIFQNMFID